MKIVFVICCSLAFVAVQCTFATESFSELTQRLEAIMLNAERPHLEITQEMAAATPEQRKQLVAAILRIVEPALRAPQPWSDANFRRIGVSASALVAASDDDAILAVFGSNLSRVGFLLEPDVVLALSACRDSKAAEALADLARLRLKQIKDMIPRFDSLTDEEKRSFNDTVNSLFYGLKGLAKRANEPDKAVARELGAEFAKLFDGSPYRMEAVQGLAEELDPLLRGTTQPAIPHGRAPAAASTGLPKQSSPSKSAKSEPASQFGRVQGAPKIGMAVAAIIGSVIILGVFIWFLRKK